MSSDVGHPRLPRTLPRLEATSRTDTLHSSSFGTTEDGGTRQDDKKKKKKILEKEKEQHEQLNKQSESQVVGDHTEVAMF